MSISNTNYSKSAFSKHKNSQKKPSKFLIGVFRLLAQKNGCSVMLQNTDTVQIIKITHKEFVVESEVTFITDLMSGIVSQDPELIIGEGYMQEKWWMKEGKLEDFLSFSWNVSQTFNIISFVRQIFNMKRFSKWQTNDPTTAKSNIAHHYDSENPDNQLFKPMLGSIPCYSAGLYDTPQVSLEEAQRNKVERILEIINPKPHSNALDIGSGWGVLTKRLYDANCNVTGITLSHEQLTYCENKFTASPKFKHELADYRNFFENSSDEFDIITCIEVLDHIGKNQFDSFFNQIQNNLSKDGVFFIQLIARPKPGQTSGWIQKYIYPGGYIASLAEVEASYEAAGMEAVTVDYIDGFHYAQTLRDWRTNFIDSWDKIKNPNKYTKEFFNKWMFFFAYSIAAFDNSNFHNYHILLRKR